MSEKLIWRAGIWKERSAVIRNTVVFLVCGSIFFLQSCSLFFDEKKEIQEFVSLQNANGKILQLQEIDSIKDPGVEFVFDKSDSEFFFAKKNWLYLADSYDLEYYSKRFKKIFNAPKKMITITFFGAI